MLQFLNHVGTITDVLLASCRRLFHRQLRHRMALLALSSLLCVIAQGLDTQQLAAESIRRPNIMFILTEDQGAHLSLLKTPGLQTPHIDALAKSGVYFDNAFVAYPVCSASKAALYTGLHSHTNGILNNTPNFHKPAREVTPAEHNLHLAKVNRVRDQFRTLPEILKANGYYQGVTHKLHVLPNRKFPYDEFLHGGRQEIREFMDRAAAAQQPWFLMVNISNSHRPYPNSDKQPIRVDPNQVQLPAYLPDTPVVRQDWAEYLAGIEKADQLTGEALDVLRQSGADDNTIVIFMSDHGPTFPHGKMTLHDLGLRVPLAIRGPGIRAGVRSSDLVSELDLLPTLLELIAGGWETKLTDADFPYQLHGHSIASTLTDTKSVGHDFIFAQISNRGPLPNDGIQERSVFDGRWKLIYRENVAQRWRQVNADSRMFKTWGNRSYAETLRVKEQFPEAFRVLAEMDPQELGGDVPPLELYDLQTDADEMRNLADDPEFRDHQSRLLAALSDWVAKTQDTSIKQLPSAVTVVAADQSDNRAASTFPVVASKKGLQVEIPEDAVALGVKHAVYNFNLTSLFATNDSPENPSWTRNGKQYFFDRSYVAKQDADIKSMSDSGALVYLVVLVYRSHGNRTNDFLLHPDFDETTPNHLSAFNTVTPEGREALAAALEFMANRWSGSESTHGRVVGYIIGNEVNSHWWWSNCGEKTMPDFVDEYADAIQITSDAVRTASDWARVYVSLEHHWTIRYSKNDSLRSFAAKDFLEHFAAVAKDRGDPEWHLAFHPYPEDLFDPAFWKDDTATPDANSPRVTFKNLEALTAFMRQPDMQFRGQPRSIILSEQGFHSPRGLEGERLQAAAYCYAYRIVAALDEIDAFVLHRHVDHPREGGLNLGLRKYDPDDRRSRPKKLIYDAFLNADRENWRQSFEFALPIIGLNDWP